MSYPRGSWIGTRSLDSSSFFYKIVNNVSLQFNLRDSSPRSNKILHYFWSLVFNIGSSPPPMPVPKVILACRWFYPISFLFKFYRFLWNDIYSHALVVERFLFSEVDNVKPNCSTILIFNREIKPLMMTSRIHINSHIQVILLLAQHGNHV